MRLVVATKNAHKKKEIQSILAGLPIEVLDLNDINFLGDIEETGQTFQENACMKAIAISRVVDDLVLADDSGIEIDAFHKEPGIYSARYLGHDTPYSIKNQTILDRMKDVQERSARFVCAIAVYQHGKQLLLVQETFEGAIGDKIAGVHGFGYDPIFHYPPMNKSAAEMTDVQKNEVSHRGKAMKHVLAFLQEYAQ